MYQSELQVARASNFNQVMNEPNPKSMIKRQLTFAANSTTFTTRRLPHWCMSLGFGEFLDEIEDRPWSTITARLPCWHMSFGIGEFLQNIKDYSRSTSSPCSSIPVIILFSVSPLLSSGTGIPKWRRKSTCC